MSSRMHIAVAAMVLACAGLARAATPQQVEDAIRRGVQWIYSQQNDQGNWERVPAPTGAKKGYVVEEGQWGGLTSMATLALLAAGEDPKDPRVEKAVRFCRDSKIVGIYALGLRAQIWAYLPRTDANKLAARRDFNLLLDATKGAGDARGMYGYFTHDASQARYDHSVSQFGVLGMYGLAQVGIEVPQMYWRVIDQEWRRHQLPDGGWGYVLQDKNPSRTRATPSMTSAGLATLMLAKDQLVAADPAACIGNAVDENLNRAIAWMDSNAGNMFQGHTGSQFALRYYAVYGLQRVGAASGLKYLGKTDWYKLGSDDVVTRQKEDGSWEHLPDTAFAILFLVHGRAPIMLNKLQYDLADEEGEPKEGNWNERPRDVANITRWISQQAEWRLNWQVTSLSAATDLSDAPVLYISGNQALRFKPEQVASLRTFVEDGGLILGNADCASREFADSFRKLGSEMFPLYEFRELPEGHPIYTGQPFKREKWKSPPSVLGLSNGARELMVLLPVADPARWWHAQAHKGREALFEVGANIVYYAVDQYQTRSKGDTHIVRRDDTVSDERTMKVARLRYAGNWDPEPGGWRRLAHVLHNRDRIGLTVEEVVLGEKKLDKTFAAAHLTGTAAFALTPEQARELMMYIARGGTLLIDSAGGSAEFANSAEALIGKLIAGGKLERIELADALLGQPPVVGAAPVQEADAAAATIPATTSATTRAASFIEYRRFARSRVGAMNDVRLKGVRFSKRWAIVYSPEDLSVGLVGHRVDGIYGYAPATATELMRRIVVNLAPAKQQ
mgnify:CR=1 FL=1